MLIDDSETVYDQDIATKQARTVQLQTGPNGITYYLEPVHGCLRGIVCRRADGTRVRAPDALDGTFTDVVNATKAVERFLANKGKARPAALEVPIREFSTGTPLLNQVTAPKDVEPDAAELGLSVPDEEFEVMEESAPAVQVEVADTLNLSKGAIDPDGETVTQRTRRERMEAAADAGSIGQPTPTPKTTRAPRTKK